MEYQDQTDRKVRGEQMDSQDKEVIVVYKDRREGVECREIVG